jgi:hypothetical protein
MVDVRQSGSCEYGEDAGGSVVEVRQGGSEVEVRQWDWWVW